MSSYILPLVNDSHDSRVFPSGASGGSQLLRECNDCTLVWGVGARRDVTSQLAFGIHRCPSLYTCHTIDYTPELLWRRASIDSCSSGLQITALHRVTLPSQVLRINPVRCKRHASHLRISCLTSRVLGAAFLVLPKSAWLPSILRRLVTVANASAVCCVSVYVIRYANNPAQ